MMELNKGEQTIHNGNDNGNVYRGPSSPTASRSANSSSTDIHNDCSGEEEMRQLQSNGSRVKSRN